MTTRRIPFFVAFFLFNLSSLSLAVERPVTINLWPLFHYTSDPVEGRSEAEGFGPVFHWRKERDGVGWGIRPLFYWTSDEAIGLRRMEFLYPLGKFQIKGKDEKGYLFPLSSYRRQSLDSKEKWDFQFFPFFIGETEEGEDYFGLFPFFGHLLKRYGKDEIRFYLWPLYSDSLSEGDRTRNVLWPFFSFTSGEKKRGYRVWPLFGRREEIGVSSQVFFLWPIFIERRRGLNTDDPVHEWMIFPFYVSKESKYFRARTVLWPFFSHVTEERTGFEQWDFPWPLFRTFRGKNLHGRRFFLFYGDKVREGESKRFFILYPLYRYEEIWLGNVQETTHHILFSRIRKGEDSKGRGKWESVRIWPLYDYEREETGAESFNIFYLLPFKEEGLERNLFPFFRVYRSRKEPDGAFSANLFWGFYKRIKKEGLSYWEIAHLMTVKRWNGIQSISILKGLFSYRKDRDSLNLRIFFLPLRFCQSGSPSAPSSETPPPRPGATGNDTPQAALLLWYPQGGLRNEMEPVTEETQLGIDFAIEERRYSIRIEKEYYDDEKKDRDIGDRFLSSGEGSLELGPGEDPQYERRMDLQTDRH